MGLSDRELKQMFPRHMSRHTVVPAGSPGWELPETVNTDHPYAPLSTKLSERDYLVTHWCPGHAPAGYDSIVQAGEHREAWRTLTGRRPR